MCPGRTGLQSEVYCNSQTLLDNPKTPLEKDQCQIYSADGFYHLNASLLQLSLQHRTSRI